jgi:hypothetical protein
LWKKLYSGVAPYFVGHRLNVLCPMAQLDKFKGKSLPLVSAPGSAESHMPTPSKSSLALVLEHARIFQGDTLCVQNVYMEKPANVCVNQLWSVQ